MERLLQDLRFAWRLLWKRPAFTLIAVASLALGIGANTAIFSLVDALLLRPLPVADPPHLVSIFTVDEKNPGFNPSSHLNWKDLRAQNTSFSSVVGYDWEPVNVLLGGEPTLVDSLIVSGDYFSGLGVRAAHGRTFSPEDDQEGAGRAVVVISDRFWRQRLGGDPKAVGQTLTINNHPFTVIGVAPPGFFGTDVGVHYDLWEPMAVNKTIRPDPATNWYGIRRGLMISALGRLKPGVSFGQAQSEMAALSGRLQHDFPKENKGRSFKLLPLAQAAINPDARKGVVTASSLLLVIVGLVLLIACANVANLLLARASARQKEIAVRLSIGSPRGRLIRQLLTESLLLALLGGACGLLLAAWANRLLAAVLPSVHLPFATAAIDLRLDPRVLLFTLALSLVTGLLFGLVPALQSSRPELVTALKSQVAPGAGSGHPGLAGGRLTGRNLLVAAQVALSLVALVAAGLFLRSLGAAQRADPGFAADRLLRVHFNLVAQGYSVEKSQAFLRTLVERVSAIPGVATATLASSGPLQPAMVTRSIYVEGQSDPDSGTMMQLNSIAPRYFEAIGVPILRGRPLTAEDREGAPYVGVINQFLADKFFPGQDPVGRHFKLFGSRVEFTIVGVAKNTRYNTVDEDLQPYIYISLGQIFNGNLTLLVRSSSDPATLLPVVERELHNLDKQLPIAEAATLKQVLHEGLWAPRMSAALLGIFAILALLLAAVGIYGVMSFSVAQRAREIGIRMALGAEPRGVLGLVLTQGMTIVAIGLGVGLFAAFAISRLAAKMLYGVSPTDPLTFAGTVLLLAFVALVATLIPARRATAVDPVLVLKGE